MINSRTREKKTGLTWKQIRAIASAYLGKREKFDPNDDHRLTPLK